MSHAQVDMSDPAVLAYLLVGLHQKLSKKFNHVDEHLLDGSIDDALLRHLRCPERFDASRDVPLSYYLELWIRSYLDMKRRRVSRRRKHEKAAGVSDKVFEKILSETRGGGCIYLGKNRTDEEGEEQREEAERRKEAFDTLVARLNPHDRAGVELLRTGASHEEWVQHLGIVSLPQSAQRRKVNLEKDRLKKTLKRWAQKMQGGGLDLRTEDKFGQPVLTRVERVNHG
jgi:hypothetical protein